MRGPKVRTQENSRQGVAGSLTHEGFDPPCKLSMPAKREYYRLVGLLDSAGTIERVDLMCVANAARIKALLDRAYRDLRRLPNQDSLKAVNMLTTQHRGLLRELGLTSQPSRTVFRAKPKGSERDDQSPWAGKLKVS